MEKGRRLNFITKVILIVLAILLVAKGSDVVYIMVCQGLALFLIALAGKTKLIINSVVLVALVYGINYGFTYLPYENSYLWQLIYLPLQIFVLVFLYLVLAVATTKIEDLHAVMQFLHLPNSFILSTLVKIRFWQTLRDELKNIRVIMRMRGLGKSPFKIIEQVYSPLLADGVKTNDELIVSAYLRGLGTYRSTTALHKLPFSFLDVFSFFVVLLLIAFNWGLIVI